MYHVHVYVSYATLLAEKTMIMIIIVLAYVGLAVLDNVSIADLWEDVGYYHRYCVNNSYD